MKYLILAVALAVSAGCVYSPVQIDVYVPTTATLSDSNVSLDAHKGYTLAE
jgi:hypothetical protein